MSYELFGLFVTETNILSLSGHEKLLVVLKFILSKLHLEVPSKPTGFAHKEIHVGAYMYLGSDCKLMVIKFSCSLCKQIHSLTSGGDLCFKQIHIHMYIITFFYD